MVSDAMTTRLPDSRPRIGTRALNPLRGLALGAILATGAFLPAMTQSAETTLQISAADRHYIAQRIRVNETGQRNDRLIWWNAGEGFASLGIGHFIWYPPTVPQQFKESFPALVAFIKGRGKAVPQWIETNQGCPWANREAFQAAAQSRKMRELREFIADTLGEQAEFLLLRLVTAKPHILDAVDTEQRPVIANRFSQLMQSKQGRYALVDYVNFKGEGLDLRERHKGQGWGLLQVLKAMSGDPSLHVAEDFANAATGVLTARVSNSPVARNEKRWLKGWIRRIDTYREIDER